MELMAPYPKWCADELDRLRAENKVLRDALKPFANLRTTRFMTDGIRYDFRVDAAWIRKARAVSSMEE